MCARNPSAIPATWWRTPGLTPGRNHTRSASFTLDPGLFGQDGSGKIVPDPDLTFLTRKLYPTGTYNFCKFFLKIRFWLHTYFVRKSQKFLSLAITQWKWLHPPPPPSSCSMKHCSFQCGVCGKAYTHSGSLNVHARLHSQERPFQCRVCCKAFAEKTVLNKHAATHSGIKPFQCDSCGKPFRYWVGAKIFSVFYLCKVNVPYIFGEITIKASFRRKKH